MAPQGLFSISLTSDGHANEQAVMSAMARKTAKTGQAGNWKVISFKGCCHGTQSLGQHHLTHGGSFVSQVDYPSLVNENDTISQLEEMMSSDVAAVIIEPFAPLSGLTASSSFLDNLSKLCHKHDTSLIIDETNTGYFGAGHKRWMSDSMTERPDYLVFGKRAQVSGFFSNQDDAHRSSNGDVRSMLSLKVIDEVVKSEKLNDKTSGTKIGESLSSLKDRSSAVESFGGYGGQWTIKCQDETSAKKLWAHSIENGVIMKLISDDTLATRPALNFDDKHASIFDRALRSFN
jgi:acetylornithine/succinyldiaminopimelate/putrescine aminotransferase